MKDSLTAYLRRYYEMQSKIMLVYHPTPDSYWGDRCFFLDENYNQLKEYNHRGILHNEIVIEFDDNDKAKNIEYANEVCNRLRKDGIPFSKWDSGNKSVHVHCFIQPGDCRNVQLLKKCFMRYYSEGLPLPDLQLAVDNHLVRAEMGLHEKTGKRKSKLFQSADYPRAVMVRAEVWQRYNEEMGRLVARRMTTDVNELTEHPGIKYILTTHQFREAEDGRERALFIVIHVLKSKYKNKDEFIKYLQEWYKYSGGHKMSDADIANKVHYHWSRDYNITERYINEFLESINKKELMSDGKSNSGTK